MLNTNTGTHLGDFLHDPLNCLEDGGLLQQQDGVRLDPVSLKRENKNIILLTFLTLANLSINPLL
jgi:hypothetical protein